MRDLSSRLVGVVTSLSASNNYGEILVADISVGAVSNNH